MNQPWQTNKPKNWQWRIIIFSGLFLIFGKGLGHLAYRTLGIDQVYSATTNVVNKVGLSDVLNAPPMPASKMLTIDVQNDTASQYTIETKITTGNLDFADNTFFAGEIKRFTINPGLTPHINGAGDIVFVSAPIRSGNRHSLCQEIHTLNYDMAYVKNIKRPLKVNLSSIHSKMNCQEDTPSLGQ